MAEQQPNQTAHEQNPNIENPPPVEAQDAAAPRENEQGDDAQNADKQEPTQTPS
jgi:hypothetical protein